MLLVAYTIFFILNFVPYNKRKLPQPIKALSWPDYVRRVKIAGKNEKRKRDWTSFMSGAKYPSD